LLLAASLSPALQAAPLDALLSAGPPPGQAALGLHLEVAADRVNGKLDLLNLRNSDPRYAGTRIGDYTGQHLRGSLELSRLRLDGAVWQRRLQDSADIQHFGSWQVGGQFRLTDDAQAPRHWALRASAWGNRADKLMRSTNTRLGVDGINTQVREVQINAPSDLQRQLDLIVSQAWAGQQWSAFAGAGKSVVGNAGVTGQSTIGNCAYGLVFGPTELSASPAGNCGNLIISVPNKLLPYSAEAETNFHARYLHLGLSQAWQGQTWGTRLGYEFQHWQRERIDTLIVQRGGKAYTDNHTVVGELSARLTPGVSALLRAQLMRHQFVGELPLAYNTLSANRFGSTYGIVSIGLSGDF
jgi:hypothetical protein